jgi:hypothetical protein
MPKHVGDLISTINCLQHPWSLVGFFHPFMENARYNFQDTLFLSDCNETWIFSKDFGKILKFHQHLSSGSRVVSCWHTDRQTDMAKLIVTFRKFSNEPKNNQISNFIQIHPLGAEFYMWTDGQTVTKKVTVAFCKTAKSAYKTGSAKLNVTGFLRRGSTYVDGTAVSCPSQICSEYIYIACQTDYINHISQR